VTARRRTPKLALMALLSAILVVSALTMLRPGSIARLWYGNEVSQIQAEAQRVENFRRLRGRLPSEPEIRRTEFSRLQYRFGGDAYSVGLSTGFDDDIFLLVTETERCWWYEDGCEDRRGALSL
jgi:hypothetical protein